MVDMRVKNAFSLVEILIVLAVIAIVATLTNVTITQIIPDKDTVFLRKAYNNLEIAVGALVNNDDIYGSTEVFKAGDLSNTTAPTGLPISTGKFCYYISEIMDTVSVNCSTSASPQTFTTLEGIVWRITDNLGAAAKTATVTIDVNGAKAGGTYTFTVYNTGKIASDANAKTILSSPYDNRRN